MNNKARRIDSVLDNEISTSLLPTKSVESLVSRTMAPIQYRLCMMVMYTLLIISMEIFNVYSFSVHGRRSTTARKCFTSNISSRRTDCLTCDSSTQLLMTGEPVASSSTPRSEIGQAKIPLRIAVAGAGIGGMFLG